MTPKSDETRALARLRSACRTDAAKDLLRQALDSGWPALAIEGLITTDACNRRLRKGIKRLYAIQEATSRRYYSPEERSADEARFRERQAAEDARAAIKATKATRPAVPPEYKAIRTACVNMLNCDHLSSALEAGWKAADILRLARAHSGIVGRRVYGKETPGAIRLVLELIQGWPAGRYRSYLP
jgi:hypothetical protein